MAGEKLFWSCVPAMHLKLFAAEKWSNCSLHQCLSRLILYEMIGSLITWSSVSTRAGVEENKFTDFYKTIGIFLIHCSDPMVNDYSNKMEYLRLTGMESVVHLFG